MLRKILTIGLLLYLCVSCDEDFTSRIPHAPVNVMLDLNGRDKVLASSLLYIEYPFPPIMEAERDKFGYGGVLVIHGLYGDNLVDRLYAFDLACPNEAQANIKVKPDDMKGTALTATCPKCGAVYNIASGGAAESGSKFWLRRYNVVQESGSDTRFKVIN